MWLDAFLADFSLGEGLSSIAFIIDSSMTCSFLCERLFVELERDYPACAFAFDDLGVIC